MLPCLSLTGMPVSRFSQDLPSLTVPLRLFLPIATHPGSAFKNNFNAFVVSVVLLFGICRKLVIDARLIRD